MKELTFGEAMMDGSVPAYNERASVRAITLHGRNDNGSRLFHEGAEYEVEYTTLLRNGKWVHFCSYLGEVRYEFEAF